MTKFTETKISLHYSSDDPSNPLYHHQIDLEQLAPILSAVSKMFRDVNRISNDDDQDIKVRIGEGGVKKGSIELLFTILQSPEAISVLKALGIMVTGGSISLGGVMEVIKKLRGRKIKAVIQGDNPDSITIQTVDGEELSCTQAQKRLITDKTFRKHLDQVFSEPFQSTNATKISFGVVDAKTDEEATFDIKLHESDALSTPDEIFETNVVKTNHTVNVKFRSVSVKDSEDWVVEFSQKEHKVEILDKAFLTKLQDEETGFNFGRLYKSDVEKTVTTKPGHGRAKTEYKIKKVYIS
ncbi:MAG: hypothetical protein COB09_02550 [Thalassobium sp.]|nr:MAG: hypothetical protein COB09_02550 [Thalassobium sp.]